MTIDKVKNIKEAIKELRGSNSDTRLERRRTVWFFIIYGIPRIWKHRGQVMAAWFAAQLTAITSIKRDKGELL